MLANILFAAVLVALFGGVLRLSSSVQRRRKKYREYVDEGGGNWLEGEAGGVSGVGCGGCGGGGGGGGGCGGD